MRIFIACLICDYVICLSCFQVVEVFTMNVVQNLFIAAPYFLDAFLPAVVVLVIDRLNPQTSISIAEMLKKIDSVIKDFTEIENQRRRGANDPINLGRRFVELLQLRAGGMLSVPESCKLVTNTVAAVPKAAEAISKVVHVKNDYEWIMQQLRGLSYFRTTMMQKMNITVEPQAYSSMVTIKRATEAISSTGDHVKNSFEWTLKKISGSCYLRTTVKQKMNMTDISTRVRETSTGFVIASLTPINFIRELENRSESWKQYAKNVKNDEICLFGIIGCSEQLIDVFDELLFGGFPVRPVSTQRKVAKVVTKVAVFGALSSVGVPVISYLTSRLQIFVVKKVAVCPLKVIAGAFRMAAIGLNRLYRAWI